MPFSTYEELKSSILSFLGRPDDPLIPVADLIALAETDANRKLKVRQMEGTATINAVAGQASYPLPDDFMEARYVKLTSDSPTYGGIEYMTPDHLDEHWPYTSGQQVANFTIEAESIRFGPAPPPRDPEDLEPPETIYTVTLHYWKKIPALSDTNPTNFLLTDYPDLLLFSSLAEAELYLGSETSDARFSAFIARREAIYQSIRLADRQFKIGSAPLVMRVDGPTP